MHRRFPIKGDIANPEPMQRSLLLKEVFNLYPAVDRFLQSLTSWTSIGNRQL
jgi:hypothetical protein